VSKSTCCKRRLRQLIDQLHSHTADIAICTEKVDEFADLVVEQCYEWHHAAVVPHQHPLSTGEITLERLASFPILTYSFGFTGRSRIESAFKNTGLELDITLAAADTGCHQNLRALRDGRGCNCKNGL